MSTFRPLPSKPSLEFEHKEAKALHRLLKAGDADALARAHVRHPAINAEDPEPIKLADAQLVIAREYGFASWPRLVRYFGDVERQSYFRRGLTHEPGSYEWQAKWLLTQHRQRSVVAGRALSAYVPRFYGLPLDEIFEASVTEDEARLAVARGNGFPSWHLLLERSAEDTRLLTADEWEFDPFDPARKAIAAADVGELQRLVDKYPQLLEVRDDGAERRPSLLGGALFSERKRGVEALRPIMEWLSAHGFDVQRALNDQLCGRMRRMEPETVQYLLDRGADPNWVTPGGVPVLERALIKYQDPEAVDVLARHVVPRRALWIAAGLGDVDGVRSFLDRDGKPTPAARRIRPDFVATHLQLPQHPDPDDEEILLEAFFVAMLNDRVEVLEYMISRGTPVNGRISDVPLINFAIGIWITPVVIECLVRAGADLDIKGYSDMTARELARELYAQDPLDPDRRRIAQVCSVDLEAAVAARDARPLTQPGIHPHLEQALVLANDDATRLGQSDVRPENLLFGMLRNRRGALHAFMRLSKIDFERFRADVNDRMRAVDDRVESARLPLHADAQAIVDSATAAASKHRNEIVYEYHVLRALLQDERGEAAELLRRYGGSAAKFIGELERAG